MKFLRRYALTLAMIVEGKGTSFAHSFSVLNCLLNALATIYHLHMIDIKVFPMSTQKMFDKYPISAIICDLDYIFIYYLIIFLSIYHQKFSSYIGEGI